MPLMIKSKDMLELMKNFYILTGLRLVLFDENYNEIMSYPAERSPFCRSVRTVPEFEELCNKCDRAAFEKCKKSRSPVLYKCHAGLFEATAPITENGYTIGYIMFGQIADKNNKDEFLKQAEQIKEKLAKNIDAEIEKIKYKSSKQLEAAANILDVCTSYILNKELITPSRARIFNSIDKYITTNLNQPITVETLCREFNISRTRLYEYIKPYTEGGIAAYIREKRLQKARELLRTTDMTVAQISDATGFSDYNYFLRAFKKRFGTSAKKIQKYPLVVERVFGAGDRT